MMALKLLPILQVIIILCSPSYSYPTVYGTKRYGRLQRSNTPSWGANTHFQPYLRTQRYPLNYYDMYPYNQNYADEYYYPHEAMSYPVYYPPARTSKYEVYQAVLPYYYDRPVMGSGFDYYGYDDGSDPIVDLEEEMLQEAEREQREDAQPIGQEMYYENDANSSNENFNDVNAAFLQNLIMSQMYKDSLDKSAGYSDEVYGKVDEYPPSNSQGYYGEDEDVLELKQLAKPFSKAKDPTPEDRLHFFQRSSAKKPVKQAKHYYDNEYLEQKRAISDRKVAVKGASSTVAPYVTGAPKTSRGQKEEVLLRPATPVKHPFTNPVIAMVSKKNRDRTPSVYDTIKHMLDMEKSLENGNDVKPAMRKRIVSSEDSLTHQLSVLKKQ